MATHATQAFLCLATLLAITSSLCFASDPSPLQDFCVADAASNVFVNGFACKSPEMVKAEDFFFSGLNKPGPDTPYCFGCTVTQVTVDQIPGLNTLGVSLGRIDFPSFGFELPHIHPRATEIVVALEGSLFAVFTYGPNYLNTTFSKILHEGDVFVFPQGLPHAVSSYEGSSKAVAFAAFGSQNPGLIPIYDPALAKAFQVSKELVDKLEAI